MDKQVDQRNEAQDDPATVGEDTGTASWQQAQLSLTWPDEVRGAPNVALRGALFSISQEREVYRKRTRIATVEGYEIRLKGERFNQRDLDLWLMLLHLGRQQSGSHVEFSASELLRSLDRGVGGADYDELKEDIARLMSTYVEITCANLEDTFAGHLVANMLRQESTQRYAVFFDDKIHQLFGAGLSHIHWEQRKKLRKNSLAQWLHGWFTTHATVHSYKVATLKTLSGSKAERLTDFRKALRVALARLEAVGAITNWSIDPDTDLVKIRKKPTPSQLRHLVRKQSEQNDKEFSANGQLFDGD